ncbi:hypothetical protein [Serpentinimonas maccroryi]|uniref:hypothetical protein n=1 Tax=Serpentinimonas maccroryi TaxID=1458426 RepID=UPI0020343BEE|nr:hypothetical protein [Serpentinimonas maccroryi]MCM2479698.1 hypothetical protein [Serpentinimonas maccroryi]
MSMLDAIAGGIAGAMLEYAQKKKWGNGKAFFYPFFVFSSLGFIGVHFFHPTESGFFLDALLAVGLGTFLGLAFLTITRTRKPRDPRQ